MPPLPHSYAFLLSAFFLGLLLLPAVDRLFLLDPTPRQNENRALARLPSLRLKGSALKQIPRRYEAYFNDHFGFRQLLIRWHGLIKVLWLGESPNPVVIIGRQEWLFFASSADQDAVKDYRGLRSFSAAQSRAIWDNLAGWQAWCEARGIAFLAVIAPDKHSIYPEYLPMQIHQESPCSRLDRFLAAREPRHARVAVLDLRQSLLQAKTRGRLYHKTDTHWNELGAAVAYEAILAQLKPSLPELAPPADLYGDLGFVEAPGMDLASMIALTDRFREQQIVALRPQVSRASLRTIQPKPLIARSSVPNKDLPRAVFLCDSFIIATALNRLLAEHFSEAVYAIRADLDPQFIEQLQPHLLLREVVERDLGSLDFPPCPQKSPPP